MSQIVFLTMLRVFISIHLAFNGMSDAVISQVQRKAALQVAGASPTVEDLMREHILFTTSFTSQRETATFQNVPVLSHGKPAVPQILEGGGVRLGGGVWGVRDWRNGRFLTSKIPAYPICALRTGLRVRQVIMRPLKLQ